MNSPEDHPFKIVSLWLQQKNRLHIALIILAGVTLYSNSLFNGFIWDDESQIVNNLALRNFSQVGTFFGGSTFYGGGSENLLGLYYRPITTTFFSLLVSLFGPNPFPFHFTSLALHIFNAVLVLIFFKRFFSNKLAFLLTLLFLTHPIHTEVVDYASGLGDLISFSFGAAAFLLLTKEKKIEPKRLLIIALLFLCSLLAKETGLLFLVTAFIYRVLSYKEFVSSTVPPLASLLTYLSLRGLLSDIQAHTQNFVPIMAATFTEKLLSAPKIITYYINHFFFPLHLAISQHWIVQEVNFNDFYLPLLEVTFFLGVLMTLYFLARKHGPDTKKLFLVSSALLLMGIAAHLHIVPLFMTVADRWFYVPSVGLIGILGVSLILLREKIGSQITKIGTLCLILIIATFATRTFMRNFDWKDGYTLYSHDLQLNPHSYELENNLGQEFYRRGNLDEAKKHFEASINLTSDNWFALNNLGTIYFRQNDIPNARRTYQQVVDNSDLYLAYENLARILILHDTPESAKDFTEQSLKKFPENPRLWGILAIAHSRLHNSSEALRAAKKAFEIKPDQINSLIYQELSQGKQL